jgi:diphthamide synthase subunit DPH2
MTIENFVNNAENQFAVKKYVAMEIPQELRHKIYDAVEILQEKGYQKVSVDWDTFYMRSF